MPVIDYKAKREAYEDEHFVKQIDCPEHTGQHKATLFCEGHRFAGTWECPEGFSDSHDHYKAFEDGVAELEIEDGEADTMTNGEHDTYSFRYYACGGEQGCGIQLEGDPDADAAEDRADAEADNWRDEE